MNESMVAYTSDLLIFGIDNRKSNNCRTLPDKYLSILLVKRDKEPFLGSWCLPGGYVKGDETSKEASVRILKKETNLENVYMQQIGVYDDINRDPRGRTISSAYLSLVDKTLLKQELNSSASWFDIEISEDDDNIDVRLTNELEIIEYKVKKIIIDEKTNEYNYKILSPSILAFDHAEIIIKGIIDLRNRVSNTDIVFNLMPREFTIGQLKQVYEVLLGKKLINSAFRRTIGEKLEETGKMVKTGGHRPSMLFTYRKRV